MKVRTLILGTAAAFAVSGGAQAADLALAVEPIDYVKVCDAFGTGYYYIPGTDTCLKIGGHLRFDAWWYDDSKVGDIDGQEVGVDGDTIEYSKNSYSQSWEFKTEAAVNFTSRTMSDLGPVVTHFAFVTQSNNNDLHGSTTPGEYPVRFDGGYGAIGPVSFGWTDSTFDYKGGYTYDGTYRSDKKTDQVRLAYSMGTWGLMLGLEDPRDRWAGTATGDFPDIILALTGGTGGWDFKASVGVTDRTFGTGWGAALGATVDLGGGAAIRGNIAYSDDAPSFVGGPGSGSGTWWSAFLSGIVALSGTVNAVGSVSYIDGPGGANGDAWQGALGLQWHPTAKSEIGLEVLYTAPDVGSDSVGVHARMQTDFN